MKVIRTSTKLIRDDIINKGIGKILGVLNSKRVSQLYDAVCMFLSTGAFLREFMILLLINILMVLYAFSKYKRGLKYGKLNS